MSAPPPPQPTQTWRFDSVGQGFQTWTVPDGVSAVTAIVAGASGGQTNPKVCAVRERKLRRIDFLLTVEGSRISRATACESGAAAARLRSAFDLSGGSHVLRVDAHRTWRCAGGVLTMQPLPAD